MLNSFIPYNCSIRLQWSEMTLLFQGKRYNKYRESTFVEEGLINDKFQGIPPNVENAYLMKDGNIYFQKS